MEGNPRQLFAVCLEPEPSTPPRLAKAVCFHSRETGWEAALSFLGVFWGLPLPGAPGSQPRAPASRPPFTPAHAPRTSLPALDVPCAPLRPELSFDKHIHQPCVLGAGGTKQRAAQPQSTGELRPRPTCGGCGHGPGQQLTPPSSRGSQQMPRAAVPEAEAKPSDLRQVLASLSPRIGVAYCPARVSLQATVEPQP